MIKETVQTTVQDGFVGIKTYTPSKGSSEDEKFLKELFDNLQSNDPQKIKMGVSHFCEYILEDRDLHIGRGHFKDLAGTIANAIRRI